MQCAQALTFELAVVFLQLCVGSNQLLALFFELCQVMYRQFHQLLQVAGRDRHAWPAGGAAVQDAEHVQLVLEPHQPRGQGLR